MQDYKLLRSHGIVCSCCRRHRGTPVGDPSLEGRRCRDQHLMATQTESEDGESVRATELGPSHPVDTVDTPIPIRHRSARRHRLGSASFATVANCIFQMTSFQTAIECRHLDMQALEWRGVLAFGFGGVIRRNQQITISRALTRYRGGSSAHASGSTRSGLSRFSRSLHISSLLTYKNCTVQWNCFSGIVSTFSGSH